MFCVKSRLFAVFSSLLILSACGAGDGKSPEQVFDNALSDIQKVPESSIVRQDDDSLRITHDKTKYAEELLYDKFNRENGHIFSLLEMDDGSVQMLIKHEIFYDNPGGIDVYRIDGAEVERIERSLPQFPTGYENIFGFDRDGTIYGITRDEWPGRTTPLGNWRITPDDEFENIPDFDGWIYSVIGVESYRIALIIASISVLQMENGVEYYLEAKLFNIDDWSEIQSEIPLAYLQKSPWNWTIFDRNKEPFIQ